MDVMKKNKSEHFDGAYCKEFTVEHYIIWLVAYIYIVILPAQASNGLFVNKSGPS